MIEESRLFLHYFLIREREVRIGNIHDMWKCDVASGEEEVEVGVCGFKRRESKQGEAR
jgi:hypothetical protein